MRKSFIRRGAYGQAPSTKPERKYLAQLGPRPVGGPALTTWLLGVTLAPDATPEQRNAACIEYRPLEKAASAHLITKA